MTQSVLADDAVELDLAHLPARVPARVVRVLGDDTLAQRLRDLGFRPGTKVETVRRAPLGDPIQFALRGYRVALRRAEAARVRVMPIEPPKETPPSEARR